ncbi:MAG: ribbon-helix-helix domain-containing protein [Candidatus Heimdallarchaeota archaeon]
MVNISVSLDEELLAWLDQLIQEGVIKSRSEAVRGGIYAFIREKLGIKTREALKNFLRARQKRPFQPGVDVIRAIREEE